MQAAGETMLVRVPFPIFRPLANAYPELWEALARLASMNQILARSAANDLALRTGRMRLAATLLRLSGQRADFQHSAPRKVIPASQQEVANLANVSLSKACDELGAFAKTKLIQLEYGRIVVLDPEELRAIIDL
jgi:CRP-like cAMP-binding protein